MISALKFSLPATFRMNIILFGTLFVLPGMIPRLSVALAAS